MGYLTGESLVALSKTYSITPQSIAERAKKDGWKQQLKQLMDERMSAVQKMFVDDGKEQIKQLLTTWGMIIEDAKKHLINSGELGDITSLADLEKCARILDMGTRNLRLLNGDQNFKPEYSQTWNDIMITVHKTDAPAVTTITPRALGDIKAPEALGDLVVE